MFLDETVIEVIGGAGGRGCVSWRREKYIPMGGPDGGDGGRGGNIVFVADENADTLSNFSSRKKFEAPKGIFGSGKNKAGKDGEDLILHVPPGTVIVEIDRAKKPVGVLADLREHGDTVIASFGGRGGFGNAHFLSSTRQRPDFAELGEPGEQKTLKLELKLVADVGIIGYPSVGKSTLISVVSNARPKIADYPFTTLIPNLGVVLVHDRSFVVCDVPGLIEGASEGKGLGDKFLKHIERTGALLHVLDIGRALVENNAVSVEKLEADYHAIRKELIAYSKTLANKRELIVLNKSDLVGGDTKNIEAELTSKNIPIFHSISAATKTGTDELMKKLLPIILEERQKREKELIETPSEGDELPVLRPHEVSTRMGAFRIDQLQDGSIRISGKRLEQFTKMTNFDNRGGIDRFRDVLDRVGVMKALKKCKMTEETPVYIGGIKVDEYL